ALEADDYAGPPAARVLASSPYWHFSALTLGDDPSAQLLRGNAGAAVPGSILPGYFGDEVIMPIFNGRDSTSFVELTEDGPGDVLSSTDGLAFSIVKLR